MGFGRGAAIGLELERSTSKIHDLYQTVSYNIHVRNVIVGVIIDMILTGLFAGLFSGLQHDFRVIIDKFSLTKKWYNYLRVLKMS